MNPDQIAIELMRKLEAKELDKIGIDEIREAIAPHVLRLTKRERDFAENKVCRKLASIVG